MKKFYIALAISALSITQNLTTNFDIGHTLKTALPQLESAYSLSTSNGSDDSGGDEGVETAEIAENDETFSEPVRTREIAIRAINPGYEIDGVRNVGEFIELSKVDETDDRPIPLAGYALRYTAKATTSNPNPEPSEIFVFPEGSYMTGSRLLLRLASAPEASQADLTYTKTLAMDAGPLELTYHEEVIDSVCWTGKNFCLSKLINQPGQRAVLVQGFGASEDGSGVLEPISGEVSDDEEWRGGKARFTAVPIEEYVVEYDAEHPGYLAPASDTGSGGPEEEGEENGSVEAKCRGLQFSEFLTYYEAEKAEQFIEIYNENEEGVELEGCIVKYKTKKLALSGTVAAGGYYVLRPESLGVTLTKNPTTTNSYEIIDVTGDVVDSMALPHGQKKATAYAWFGYDDAGKENWLSTYSPTPGEANNYQQYKSCPEGKVINEATGNCVKAATIAEAKECPAGKYRNPLTGRCKSLEEDSGLAPCKEGYERNPETNRCRKIRNNDGADYPLVPKTATEKTTFIAGMAILAVVVIGLAYIGLQYRGEVKRWVRRRFGKSKRVSKASEDAGSGEWETDVKGRRERRRK